MFPPATGPYQVGRTHYHWIDEARDEPNTVEKDYRELMVTIWYPADLEESAEMAVYREDLNSAKAEEVLDLLGANSDDPFAIALTELKTYAYQDAPVSENESSYPVLTFSHDSGSIPADYSLQLMELASHGYIVVAINHTYYSGVTVFPDGRVIGPVQFGSEMVRIQSEMRGSVDVLFVLDQLELLNTDNEQFAGRLELEQIGAFGHSMGGAIAVLAASMDTRIKAVVNEDSFIAVESYPAIEQPFMFFSSGIAKSFPAQGPKYIVTVNDFEHPSFTDFVVMIPKLSNIEGKRSAEIVRVYLMTFFNKYLKGEDSELLDGTSDAYPEVTVKAEI